METIGQIYKITCLPTKMSYIGKTIQKLSTRIFQHRHSSSYCRLLSSEIEKFGWDQFSVETIWEGDYTILGDMEKKIIREHRTLHPDGYNLREGGGTSEKVSEESRKLMIQKQKDISLRRNGLLGSITANRSKVNGQITSWSLKGHRNGTVYTIANCNSREEIVEIQKKFTKNPDGYVFPPSKRVGNGKAIGVYYNSNRKKWTVILGKLYLGTYETEDEAKDVLKKYKENPTNFVRPKRMKL